MKWTSIENWQMARKYHICIKRYLENKRKGQNNKGKIALKEEKQKKNSNNSMKNRWRRMKTWEKEHIRGRESVCASVYKCGR